MHIFWTFFPPLMRQGDISVNQHAFLCNSTFKYPIVIWDIFNKIRFIIHNVSIGNE